MNEIENIPKAPCITLADVLDEYLIQRQINQKKYFASYLVTAKLVWQKLFVNTLYVIKNEWKTLQAGDPYPYINVPKGCIRFFSVMDIDKHNRLIPLFYNDQINVIPQPTTQDCGCSKCDCTGAQDQLSGLTYTTTALFTINGITYYKKCWMKLCPNGDILQYCEVPTKKYNDTVGHLGDYNNDYNDDWLKGAPGSDNFEIVIEKFQTKICALTIRPCGCPEPTPENQLLVETFCGCFPGTFHRWFRHWGHRENTLFENINNNERGEVKLSPCGTKIYYIPPHHHHHHRPLPKYLQVVFQTSGKSTEIDGSVSVPDIPDLLECMFYGIDYFSKRFNNKYSGAQKQEAKFEFNDAINKLILFFNQISLDEAQHYQDRLVLW